MGQSELPGLPDDTAERYIEDEQDIPEKESRYAFLVNILLFLFTFFSTTIAGVFWDNKDPYQLNNFSYGLTYSFLILLVIMDIFATDPKHTIFTINFLSGADNCLIQGGRHQKHLERRTGLEGITDGAIPPLIGFVTEKCVRIVLGRTCHGQDLTG